LPKGKKPPFGGPNEKAAHRRPSNSNPISRQGGGLSNCAAGCLAPKGWNRAAANPILLSTAYWNAIPQVGENRKNRFDLNARLLPRIRPVDSFKFVNERFGGGPAKHQNSAQKKSSKRRFLHREGFACQYKMWRGQFQNVMD
jgi:hypothetical protein